MPRQGYDSVASSVAEWQRIVPANPDVIGSYANGLYANTTSARQAFPKATHYQYDVSGSRPDADVLDIEPQDAVPAQAHTWAHAHNQAKGPHVLPHPGLYCSASTMSQVVSDMLDHGWKRNEFLIVSAHYGSGPHICGPSTCHYPQADATQWDDKGAHGENTDRLIYNDHFFGHVLPPDPDARYDLFDNTRRMIVLASERLVAEEYDRLRRTQTKTKHPQGPRLRLYVLRFKCSLLSLRLKRIGHPDQFHRGWRRRELQDRAAGKRLV